MFTLDIYVPSYLLVSDIPRTQHELPLVYICVAGGIIFYCLLQAKKGKKITRSLGTWTN